MFTPSTAETMWSNKKVVEEYYPSIIALILSFGFYIIADPVVAENAKNFYDKSVDVCSIAVGFLGTAQAILLSLDQRRAIQKLKSLGHYTSVIEYLNSAICWCLTSAIVFTWLLFEMPAGNSAVYSKIWFSVSLFFATVSGLSCYRVIKIFSDILKLK
jgi:hypothetical protein